jgi:hypothetical protein
MLKKLTALLTALTALTALMTALIGFPERVLNQLGPEVHVDRYPDGNRFHFEMSRTTSGTNFQIGQPPPR